MKTGIIQLLLIVFLALGGGIAGTWYFATLDTLSRPLRDGLSMLVLSVSLLIAGILIVAILIRTDTNRPRAK